MIPKKLVRYIFPLFLSLFVRSAFAQSDEPSKLPDQINVITAEKLYSIIDASPAKLHLLYSFAYWCKPCLETMPKVLEVMEDNPQVDFYPLTVEKFVSKYNHMEQNLAFLSEEYNYTGVVYAADPVYHKKAYKRYSALIAELAPNHTDFGLSLILLLDKNKNVLYATTWHQTSDEEIEGLVKIVSELSGQAKQN